MLCLLRMGTVPIGNKRLLTTLALAAGFVLFGVSGGLGWLTKDPKASVSYVAQWEAVNYGVGFAVSLLLFQIYSRMRRLNATWLILVAALLCYGFGMLWRFSATNAAWLAGMNQQFQADFVLLFIRGGLVDGTTLGLVSLLYFAIEHWRQASEATALAQQAQLQMLRYQLNPHFLFNALNSIRGMIVEDPARSREMVTELADFLRYSLDGEGAEAAIGDELAAIESYLAIQRIRFDEKLDVAVRADETALGVAVPCFLIHPLVENAVKHGMKTSAMPLRVRVDVALAGSEIRVSVMNTGRLLDEPDAAEDGTGIGLKNITERLRLAFPGRHSFKIWESDGWVRAEMRFRPAEVPNEAHSPDRG